MAQFQGKGDGKRIITHLRSFVANLEMSFLVPTILSVLYFSFLQLCMKAQ